MLVTGATGFLGGHVCDALVERGLTVRALRRTPDAPVPTGTVPVVLPDLLDTAGLHAAVDGTDTVIHLAAHVHQARGADEAAYDRVNLDGTLALLRAAIAAGARSFVFVSTVKAVGEGGDELWTEATPPHPADAYGRSKLAAEHAVRDTARTHGLHVPILRLPLVYGPGMKSNALRLFELVDRGWPLPFGRVTNRRSLLYVGNFVEALDAVLSHERGNDLFFVCDGPPVSTPELLRAIGRALDRPARLIPVPVASMRALARIADLLTRAVPTAPQASAMLDRLVGSLAVDGSRLEQAVGYRPRFSLEQGLAATAAWYRSRGRP